MNLKKEWITRQLDDESIGFAQQLGKSLAEGNLSTSQIRIVFGEMRRIQVQGFNREFTSFLMLKPKIAYAAKRDSNKGMAEFKNYIDQCWDSVDKKDAETGSIQFDNFMKLTEAVLAYHKSYGGK